MPYLWYTIDGGYMRNPRINIVIKPETYAMLTLFAKQNKTSVSSMSCKLLEDAIEECEDYLIYKEARGRAAAFSPKKALAHKQLFKRNV